MMIYMHMHAVRSSYTYIGTGISWSGSVIAAFLFAVLSLFVVCLLLVFFVIKTCATPASIAPHSK